MYIHDHFCLSDIVPCWSFSKPHFLFLSLTLRTHIAPPTLDLHSDRSKIKNKKLYIYISCWF